jgi:DNA transformation protein and related proteins
MTPLRDMRNIGRVTAAELEASGIADGETLRALGSVGAALRLRSAGYEVCRSKLAGLEGAIRGVKWSLVPPEARAALWRRLEEEAAGR